MLKSHPFAKDAALTVLYIGAVSALVAATLTLLVLMGLGAEFTETHWAATAIASAGWIAMPFAPRLYRAKTGHKFLIPDAFETSEL